MQVRLDILKKITPLFIATDYDALKKIGSDYQFEKNNDAKTILYFVYILSLLKHNQETEAITSMLSSLRSENGFFHDRHFKNTISFILHNMPNKTGMNHHSATDEAYTMHPADVDGYSFFNRVSAEVHLVTNIAGCFMQYSNGFEEFDNEEFILLLEAWLKHGLEHNDTVAHLLSPIRIYQSVVIRRLNLAYAVQQSYYPALEMLAFLIVSHRIPQINIKEYFFTANEPIYLDNLLGSTLNQKINVIEDFLNKYQLSDALLLLHNIKHINLKLNKAIEIINQHLSFTSTNAQIEKRTVFEALMQKNTLFFSYSEYKQQASHYLQLKFLPSNSSGRTGSENVDLDTFRPN